MRKRENSKYTMTDVARLAGVSQTTVSFVINDKPDIPEETKARVLAVIAELGYRPNEAARSIRTQRTNMIGLVADEIVTTPFAGQIIKGVQDAARKHGKIVLIVNTEGEPELEQNSLDLLLSRQVEGIIYATMYHHPVRPDPLIYETHAVLLDCFDPKNTLPSVVPDEVGGGYTAARLLIERGHKKIGFINCWDDIPATSGRQEGFCQALEQAGLPFSSQYLRREESNAKGGYRAAMDVFQQPDPPTAVFCFNDRMAMGVYDALRRLGQRIPEDVAVVGFDNQELIADNLYPGLTTVQLPHYEMGEWAVNTLVAANEMESLLHPIQHKMPCPAVLRDSI